MIFAEMEYPEDYKDVHEELKEYLSAQFTHVESGLQLDSWFWVFDGDQKVALDTFSSTKHQVKATCPCQLVLRVIEVLQRTYKIRVYPEPELEGHESV